jgi:hypothetical protein
MDRCVEVLLSDPRVDPNIATVNGKTPLLIAAEEGHDRCVEVLLSDPRVDPNLCSSSGFSPLNKAASCGRDRCVELFLGDDRVDVCRASRGQTPLLSSCMQLMKSMDQVGAVGDKDPARTLVIMLRSRRIPKRNLKESIAFLFKFMPNKRQIHNAEVGGEPLLPNHKMTRLVLPVLVLMSQLKGDFRWCAHCLALTPDVDLNRCGGCNQVGYCEETPPGQKKPCHVLHWKAGHKHECARFAAEAEAEAKAEEEAAEVEAEAKAEEERAARGKGGGKGGAGGAGGAGGGGGGGGKKKGRGKKKKGR